jgi:hypothetical protein
VFAKIKKFLTTSPAIKTGEHLAIAFASAFALTAIATAEHAASTHGFQLSWSFLAGVGVASVTAGYQAIRPAIVKLLAKILGKTATAAPAKKTATAKKT